MDVASSFQRRQTLWTLTEQNKAIKISPVKKEINKKKTLIYIYTNKLVQTSLSCLVKKCLDSQFEIEKHGGENPKEREKLQPHELTLN